MSKSVLVKFKQAVHLNGKSYANNSVHEVTEELAAHPYFHKLIGAGLVVETEAAKVISPETLEERQKKLADTLLSRNKSALEAKALAAKKALEESKGGEGQKAEEADGEKAQDAAPAEESAKAEESEVAVESEEAEEAEVEHKDHPAHKNKKSKR